MSCFDLPCPPPCPPQCNCTTNDILYKGTNDLCVGFNYNDHLTDVLIAMNTFAKNRLFSIIPSQSIAVTPSLTTCNKSASITVKISADADNALSLHTDGLYSTAGSGGDSTPYTADQGVDRNTSHNFRLKEVQDGAAKKFLWNFTKAAFRAGEVTGTQWDNTNIANYSVAFGLDNQVTGANSLSGGTSNSVTGTNSIAYGNQHLVQAADAAAFGNQVAIGSAATYAFGGGSAHIINQPASAVFGRSNQARAITSLGTTQGGSFIAGLGNHTSGESSFAIGESNFMEGDFSGALGLQNELTNNYIYAFGRRLLNTINSNVVMVGTYNDPTDTGNDTVTPLTPNGTAAQPAFIVGRGYSTGVPPSVVEHGFNGLIIYQSGTARFYGGIDQRTSTRGILPANWTTVGRPTSPIPGEQGYNTTDNKMEYWNATAWIQW